MESEFSEAELKKAEEFKTEGNKLFHGITSNYDHEYYRIQI